MTTRRRAAVDRAFLQGFLLGYTAGQVETAQDLFAEFEQRAESLQTKAFRVINQARQELGLPEDPEIATTRPPTIVQ